jgi:hypothetical protein
VPLGNFAARIAEVVTRDDGAERTAVFAIDGTLADGRPLPRLHVPAAEFQRLDWVTTGWHGEAVIFAGQGTRDHTRCAIELLSRDRSRRVQYLHTGWREVAGQWAYLHADGAIGAEGPAAGVEVDLADTIGRARLPDPPSGADLIHSVRASIALLTLAPDRITCPVLGAVYRAPLGDVDFSLHLSGKSGVFKTEFAALGQTHYGASFDARQLPGSWSSTDNALEELAFAAKDMLVVVDDFKPRGGANEVQSYHRKADRLFRAVGNHCGRQRLTRDGRLRADRRPRGLILSTGEEVPNGESLRARLFILEVTKGDIPSGRLGQCQGDAAAGLYAASMAGYLRWLAGQYPAIRANLRQQRDELRDRSRREFAAGHARSPTVVADLALGLKYLFDYGVVVGAIDAEERAELVRRCWSALHQAAAAQVEHVRSYEATHQFLRLLSGALASGRGHVAGPDGLKPASPEAWGWHGKEYNLREGEPHAADTDVSFLPKGSRIGWVSGDDLYLEPEASFAAAQELARQQGESLTVSPSTLRKRLHEEDLLASTDPKREVLTVRRTLEGRRREVIHLRASVLSAEKPDQPDQGGSAPEPTPGNGGRVGREPTPNPTTGTGPNTPAFGRLVGLVESHWEQAPVPDG